MSHHIFFPLPSCPSMQGDKYHEAYQSANNTFFECIKPHIKEGDVVWVHDYHLMKLPKLLREAHLKISLVFYLHIPFPTSQIFRALPTANDLLQVRYAALYL